ncbi:MAG: class I SAM-dependent methyltransferase [Planctomycetia bacterium]|nr:class I SAM-dependent methyltransferase [Planctomycetia bacterium]
MTIRNETPSPWLGSGPAAPDREAERPLDFDLIANAAFPQGELGERMIRGMNAGHADLTAWAFQQVPFGSRVLDVGCGGGAALTRLGDSHPEIQLFGCDISPLAIQSAADLLSQHGLSERVTLVCESVSQLPFPAGFFDTVYSIESLYFWPNPKSGLDEVRRVLAPGGWFMLALEMVGGAMTDRHEQIAERLNMFCPSLEELRQLLITTGFSKIKIEYQPVFRWLCAVGQKER